MAPRLSVVVPIYNVQRYLDECLSSIAAQTLTDLEVVMVDDGSTDDSAAIAERFAAEDERFRLVRQENQGLGPARNAGVRQVHPDAGFLAFADSDDTLPPTAYQLMVQTLDATGSDFAAGNVLRFRSVGFTQSPVHRRPFAETALRTHISKRPNLVTDRTAWNKVYRRTFWDRHDMRYPGILYEDAPVSVPLHFLATSVDILSEPIYHWREREAGARSITQNRTDPKGLVDRITSMGQVRTFLKEQAAADPAFARHLRFYDENSLVEEIPLFFRALLEGGADFQEAFLDQVGRMTARIGSGVLDTLPEPLRVKYWLTAQRRLTDLQDLLRFEREYPRTIPLKGTVRHYADYPSLRDSAPVPKSVLRLDSELIVRAGLHTADWHQGRLHLSGFAYPKHLGAEHRSDAVKALILRKKGSRGLLAIPAKTVFSPEVTASTNDQPLRHCDWAGFKASLDPARLKHRGQWVDGDWQVTVGVFGRGRPRQSRLKAGQSGAAQFPSPLWVAENVRVIPHMRDAHLYIKVETVKARVDRVERATGQDRTDQVALHGQLAAEYAAEGIRLRLRHEEAGSTAVLDFPVTLHPTDGTDGGTSDSTAGDTAFTALIDPAAVSAVREAEGTLRPSYLQQETDRWSCVLVLPDGKTLDLAMDDRRTPAWPQVPTPGTADAPPRMLCFKPSPDGLFQVAEELLQPLVERVAVSHADSGFVLEGSFPLPGNHSFAWVLRHSYHAKTHIHPAEAADGRFRTVLPALPNPGYAGELPLFGGVWEVGVRIQLPGAPDSPDTPGGVVETVAHLAPGAFDALPLATVARDKEVVLQRRRYDRLCIEAARDLADDARGRYHQRRLLTVQYPAALRRPLRQAVLYDVFEGKSYSDSPRAVHEELLQRDVDLDHLWVVRDDRMVVPPTATRVVYNSPEWYDALARCRYIVGNTHLPPWIRRREGQVIVQTWHGTPLKRIGFDFDNPWFSDTGYLKDLEREAKQWSLLISPNSFSTPILRRAFGYQGEVLETGYPRNDVLLAKDAGERAEQVRRTLGLPEGKKVVLYAPTWREDRVRHQGGHQLNLQLDLEQARRSLGDDHVLLVRPHAHVVEPVEGTGDGFALDVGSYPDIQDLFLITDVLVTDYSSVMFDFAITGRPILFFTYDLEHYRDQLRGFYFDFEKQAPGPLLGTSEQLIAALRDLDPITQRYAPAYTAFREAFCDLDEGTASARVVDRMLGMR
ncbi:CDP-glycerol glycerophosphotransferase family protein [Streptacidiphilus cavernicola]|uniref:CDP-glycerol glycerophosphotransferase family protein n=1 Tax=Streptacidiphilus cavernicola TaxID=3342716 RepID=A0ABV6VYT3_9ACTN